MVYFGVDDEQGREEKIRLWLLHDSEQVPAKHSKGGPRNASQCFWREHSKVGCLCLHPEVPAHAEWAEGLRQAVGHWFSRAPTFLCLLLRTETLFYLLFQFFCGSVLQQEWS